MIQRVKQVMQDNAPTIKIASVMMFVQLLVLCTSMVVYAENTYLKKEVVTAWMISNTQDRVNVVQLQIAAVRSRKESVPPELQAELEYWRGKLENLRRSGK